ncbi:MAG: KH domain-containing protein [Candidatus Marinimicrobia bacterium]|jgi:hypothetical protein|nr:KH domain-containing protein [Candidatus Neomarinimicrobiota bacterium]
MKEFVEYLAKHLVDNPEGVKVTQIDSEKTTIYELSVADGDLGKIIGRGGKTAKALRTLLTAVSAKMGGKRAILEILE